LDFAGLLREPDERLAPTVLDFFVEDVRLEAAAARFIDLPAVRDLDAVPLAALLPEDLTAPRLVERAGDFLADERAAVFAPERDAVEREVVLEAAFDPPRAEVERDEPEREDDFFAVDEADLPEVDVPEDFFADEREAVDFAAAFLAPDLAVDFDAVLVEDFAAVLVDRDAGLAAVLVPAFFEAALFEPDFDALFAAPERDEAPVDFAAVLRAVEALLFLAPDFLAPDFAGDFALFAALVELRRAPPFFVLVDLVLVAPVSPVNSFVSGFDLSSVGIAASFKGLRVQPSRLQGNVVIPSEFRLTESVESRTCTISVDTLRPRRA
jgi:hypothetical protein